MSNLRDDTILVCAVARNVSTTFEGDFKRISKALCMFKKVLWVVVESDSTDNSVEELARLAKQHPNLNVLSLGKLKEKFDTRTEVLAHARNAYLKELLTNSIYNEVEYIAIADLNNLNSQLNENSIESAFKLSNWGMLTANQAGPYYDIWALRHKLWSPNDCWEQLEFFRSYSKRKNLTLNASVNLRMLRIPKLSPPIEVESAFGGFAIVQRRHISNSEMYFGRTQNGREICEHVSFCNEVKKTGGRIYVVPSLINTRFTDHSFRSTFLYAIYRNLGYPGKFFKKALGGILRS